MSLDKEIARGWALLEMEVETLKDKGSIPIKFIVENDCEAAIVLVPQPEVINNPDLKDGVAHKVREVVRRMEAHTVYNLSDAWNAEIKNVKEHPELRALVTQIGIKRASDMGLIARREVLMCAITTRRGQGAMLRWFYQRDHKNLITMQERHHIDGIPKGRFSTLFSKAQD